MWTQRHTVGNPLHYSNFASSAHSLSLSLSLGALNGAIVSIGEVLPMQSVERMGGRARGMLRTRDVRVVREDRGEIMECL